GNVVGAVQVCDEDQIMLITNGGTLVRTPVKDVSLVGRNTQGVKLINLTKDEKLVGLERVIEDEENDADADEQAADNTDDTEE
ncbi:DNA gyrase C-terminal beta-propeller domain-containing protein, partial [Methylophaga lonarensis]|uniref:DNA gyrase C-terminal beta-propeller domain-containing protein n=1 Tax=Methylophaga lonarensis TaxID=999151 RepID=UPI003D2CD8DD